MEQEKPESSGNAGQWWLSTEGKADGPFTESYILAGLKTNTIPPDAHACPVGGKEWKAVIQWPEFAGAAMTMPPGAPPTPPPPKPGDYASVLTNPLLPSMANWICVYAILVGPFLWVLQNFSCCITFTPTYKDDTGFFIIDLGLSILGSLISLGLTILLVFGGIRLRSLRRSGELLVKIALWSGLGGGLFLLLCHMFLGGVAGWQGGETFIDFTEQTTTLAQGLISFALLIVGLAELAFVIISLIWLHLNANKLPLSDD